jgi:cytochrome b6-f complex iron-sulfur subunit
MSTTALIAIALLAVVVLAAISLLTLARRSDVRGAGALSAETVRSDRRARAEQQTEDARAASAAEAAEAAGREARAGTTSTAVQTVTAAPPAPWSPPDPEALGVSRRQFLNRATVSLMGAGIGAFAAASFVAFLWPAATGGFGSKVNIGNINAILAEVRNGSGFFYSSEARSWVTAYPGDALPVAEQVYDPSLIPGMRAGLIATYQKCPHLGCRVPECLSSQWFECGCHGSQYNRVGEWKGGPAPRGMDHFPIEVSAAGEVSVDTGALILGMPLGTNTTGQEAEGPNCVGEADY